MDIGVTLGDTPVGVSPAGHFDSILRQVEAAQRNGIKYFFVGHHFAFEGARWLQPVPLLARLAAELDADARLATHVLIGPLYHPVPFAEELATLDIVTEGRLIVGVGLGYLRREYELLGVDFDSRADRLEELLSAARALWTGEPVEFHGRFFDLEGVSTPVVPVQVPHPPIWVGGQTLGGVRRAARIGDGWPITSNIDVTEILRRVEIYAEERRRLGKGVTRLPLRREIFLGRTTDDAVATAVRVTRTWFLAMSSLGNVEMDHGTIANDMASMVRQSFVVGTAGACVAQIKAIGDALPVDPLVTRAYWPGMDNHDVVAYLDGLGEEFIPALAEYQPVTTYPPPS